jgi:hypothetical protein
MKTEQEVATALAALVVERSDYSDATQLKIVDAEIARLKWVLGQGPDVIQVPKPKGV